MIPYKYYTRCWNERYFPYICAYYTLENISNGTLAWLRFVCKFKSHVHYLPVFNFWINKVNMYSIWNNTELCPFTKINLHRICVLATLNDLITIHGHYTEGLRKGNFAFIKLYIRFRTNGIYFGFCRRLQQPYSSFFGCPEITEIIIECPFLFGIFLFLRCPYTYDYINQISTELCETEFWANIFSNFVIFLTTKSTFIASLSFSYIELGLNFHKFYSKTRQINIKKREYIKLVDIRVSHANPQAHNFSICHPKSYCNDIKI